MNPGYLLRDAANVFSPALLFYKNVIARNIGHAIAMAGQPARLRPHVKTHKTREIVRIELAAGITKHKCATIAEAEMIASCGAPDVLLAYNLVGPNCARMARLVKGYPACRFSVLADHPKGVQDLAAAMRAAGQAVDVLIDIDVGQHRTGIAPGPAAVALYETIARTPGVHPEGLHVYDGHNHQEALAEREAAVHGQIEPVLALRDVLLKKGFPVARLIVGGTPTFPVYAKMDYPGLECAPGTCFLNDNGYGAKFRDLSAFEPAALLLTRVISRPTANRVTFDLGYKAVASDPPAGKRCLLLDVPEYETVLHNEEHFVIETSAAERFAPGDVAYALPTHICPTCALHRFAQIVEDGRVTDRWEIVARDRVLTI
jgi:D-serine deaminase-like pyridoxal phosphate-dependent protein